MYVDAVFRLYDSIAAVAGAEQTSGKAQARRRRRAVYKHDQAVALAALRFSRKRTRARALYPFRYQHIPRLASLYHPSIHSFIHSSIHPNTVCLQTSDLHYRRHHRHHHLDEIYQTTTSTGETGK